MTSSDRATARRRRENVDGGRQHSHRVLVSAEEEAVLVRLAAEQRVTVPRLLMEAALSGDRETQTDRLHAMAELFALRRQLAAIAGDVRKLVDRGMLGDATQSAANGFMERTGELAERVEATLKVLAAP